MASSGGQHHQQPATPTTTTTHEIQTQNQTTHLSNSSLHSSALAPNTTTTAATTTTSSINGRKRALDCEGLVQSSPYFKMRLIVKEIRPLVLQVLRAPDFQNCEAAQEIQQKLKLVVDLCKQQAAENAQMAKCNSASVPLNRNTRAAEERRLPAAGNNLEKPETNRIGGTYIVGGSAFGWNFITFHGTKPEYYGRTKEEFRASGGTKEEFRPWK